jgi:hypothetical protein
VSNSRRHSERGFIIEAIFFLEYKVFTISHPEMRVKYCVCDHSVVTLLNPRGVATVSHKHSLTVARHAAVVVAVPSTVHHPANYKIKIYYLR